MNGELENLIPVHSPQNWNLVLQNIHQKLVLQIS